MHQHLWCSSSSSTSSMKLGHLAQSLSSSRWLPLQQVMPGGPAAGDASDTARVEAAASIENPDIM